MTDTLRERVAREFCVSDGEAACDQMCSVCLMRADAAIALVLEEAAKVVSVKLFNRGCTCRFEVAAAIRALKENDDA